jgi:AbrB family looped-hinge helix DNA binding protein
MRTTIDAAGRLVIPRELRARVGLLAGGEVEVDILGAAVVIEPVLGHDLLREGAYIVIPATGEPIDDAGVREVRLADQR